MELLMIRHSSTRGNLLRQSVGSQDHPLAPEGVALAERRRGEMPPIDGLWSHLCSGAGRRLRSCFPAWSSGWWTR